MQTGWPLWVAGRHQQPGAGLLPCGPPLPSPTVSFPPGQGLRLTHRGRAVHLVPAAENEAGLPIVHPAMHQGLSAGGAGEVGSAAGGCEGEVRRTSPGKRLGGPLDGRRGGWKAGRMEGRRRPLLSAGQTSQCPLSGHPCTPPPINPHHSAPDRHPCLSSTSRHPCAPPPQASWASPDSLAPPW